MAPVVRALQRSVSIDSRVCVTGQHREMLDDVLSTFGMAADHDLDVMTPGQTVSGVFARILAGLSPILAEYRPDYVLVQGDTTTSTAAALASFYHSVPVGHVEAGLRTGNLASPWPEEANRRLTGVIASRHYAPTAQARDALLAEGHGLGTVVVTGNTVIDALLQTAAEVSRPGPLRAELDREFGWLDPARRLILVTGHRRESFGQSFVDICQALRTLAGRDDVEIVYPVHLNPNVAGPVHAILAGVPNVRLIAPQSYRRFIYLLGRCHLVLTDSGGVQEEAPSLRKPVLVMRDTSERMEAVEAGVARLVTTDPARIVRAVGELLDDAAAYAAMARGANPFGDGRASERIVFDLLRDRRQVAAEPATIREFAA